MIEIVGRASNFKHVTRLLQARSRHDRRQIERQELPVQDRAIILESSVICGLNVCIPVCAIVSASVNHTIHLSGTFYYSLGQRCMDELGQKPIMKS